MRGSMQNNYPKLHVCTYIIAFKFSKPMTLKFLSAIEARCEGCLLLTCCTCVVDLLSFNCSFLSFSSFPFSLSRFL